MKLTLGEFIQQLQEIEKVRGSHVGIEISTPSVICDGCGQFTQDEGDDHWEPLGGIEYQPGAHVILLHP